MWLMLRASDLKLLITRSVEMFCLFGETIEKNNLMLTAPGQLTTSSQSMVSWAGW